MLVETQYHLAWEEVSMGLLSRLDFLAPCYCGFVLYFVFQMCLVRLALVFCWPELFLIHAPAAVLMLLPITFPDFDLPG